MSFSHHWHIQSCKNINDQKMTSIVSLQLSNSPNDVNTLLFEEINHVKFTVDVIL